MHGFWAMTYASEETDKSKTVDRDAKGENVWCHIERTTPVLNTTGVYVQSATIDMTGTTFWAGAGNNPYLDFGNIGRAYISTSVTDKSAMSSTGDSVP